MREHDFAAADATFMHPLMLESHDLDPADMENPSAGRAVCVALGRSLSWSGAHGVRVDVRRQGAGTMHVYCAVPAGVTDILDEAHGDQLFWGSSDCQKEE